MTSSYRTPGVYVEEVTKFPPSVVAAETAVPAFLGFTERTHSRGESLLHRPIAIDSFLEFEQIFGHPPAIGGFDVTVDADGKVQDGIRDPNNHPWARYRLAQAVRLFYDNGGGRCYVVSVGAYDTDDTAEAKDTPAEAHLEGLDALARQDEPTLIVLPDLSGLSPTTSENEDEVKSVRADYHRVLIQALAQCAELGDRFLIADLWQTDQSTGREGLEAFRNGIGTRNLAYGAIYHPFLHTTLPWRWDEQTIRVKHHPPDEEGTSTDRLASLRSDGTTTYAAVRRILDRYTVTLPPSAAVAGVYASVDRNRGVWKAPANESLASVRGLAVEIDHALNADMNVDTRGKSINALRFFAGKGVLVWGARTLAGNDNEWRYVPVRRFFIMVEESIKKATEPFVFEPNDANTWARVRAMIESFLTLQWRQGALAGAVPADAFYVKAGLGETMTAQDILEGRMNVEIGLAALRPAEFIILRFSHKMQES